MNILIGIRRIDHIQYFKSVVNELVINSSKVYFAIDPNFLLDGSLEKTKSHVIEEFGWEIEEFFTLSQSSEANIKAKRLLGCLVYLNDPKLEWGYLLRHAKRSSMTMPGYLLLFMLRLLPRNIRIFFTTKLTLKLRKRVNGPFLINEWIRNLDLDLIYISPGNMFESKEDSLIADGKNLNIPSVIQTLSWDNLNSKGTVMAIPDLYLAWNQMHASLLVSRHMVPPENIGVPGSLFLEKYSSAVKSFGKEELCEALGIPSTKEVIVYMGSSLNVCSDESTYLKAMLERFPNFTNDYFLLIRPHPANNKVWQNWSYFGTYVWPKFQSLGARTTDETFSILRSSIGVIGINTSGFLDALACGVPIVAIENHDAIFQENTRHFSQLILDGLRSVNSLQAAISLLGSNLYKDDLVATLEKTLPNRDMATLNALALIGNLLHESRKGSI